MYTTIAGTDRNLHNLTVGNYEKVVQYHLSEAVEIAENTRSIVVVRSFKRNDVRIRKKRLQEGSNSRRLRRLEIYCRHCKRWQDRDVITAMNVAKNRALKCCSSVRKAMQVKR